VLNLEDQVQLVVVLDSGQNRSHNYGQSKCSLLPALYIRSGIIAGISGRKKGRFQTHIEAWIMSV
jgi:hypothetical protein